VFDLDGVVWLSGHAIPGSPEAVHRLRSAGHQVAFVTNNSTPTVAQYVERLADAGIDVGAEELVTSSQAAATLVPAGSRVAYLGGEGVAEALRERRVSLVGLDDDPAVLVVGRSLRLDFGELAAAARVVRAGARFIATNTDATFPTPDGPEPGAGALIAYLQVGSGRDPEVAGKPEQPMADLVKTRYGHPDFVVGDRAETDGAFARRVGSPFALVLSGVTRRSDLPVEPAPALVTDDLASAVDRLLARNGD
jgi:HAD superfamily hydrolase (TIGR01450 family)